MKPALICLLLLALPAYAVVEQGLEWDAPTHNDDGSPITDLQAYEVQAVRLITWAQATSNKVSRMWIGPYSTNIAKVAASTQSPATGTTERVVLQLPASAVYEFSVRAHRPESVSGWCLAITGRVGTATTTMLKVIR